MQFAWNLRWLKGLTPRHVLAATARHETWSPGNTNPPKGLYINVLKAPGKHGRSERVGRALHWQYIPSLATVLEGVQRGMSECILQMPIVRGFMIVVGCVWGGWGAITALRGGMQPHRQAAGAGGSTRGTASDHLSEPATTP